MKAAVFGELLFDRINNEEYLGGAASNFATHLTRLGFDCYLLSTIGDDKLGKKALAQLQSLGMNLEGIALDPDLPTGTVDVEITETEPQYRINQNVAWDRLRIPDLPALRYEMWDLFYFGTLALRETHNQDVLEALLEELTARVLFFDMNLREPYYNSQIIRYCLSKANIVKLSKSELFITGELLGFGSDPENICRAIQEINNAELIAVTDGPRSILLYTNNVFVSIEPETVDQADPVGAGDAFSAGLCFGLLHGLEAEAAARLGARLGAFVASQQGAVPEYSEEIQAVFLSLGDDIL